ncbi:potassium/proton antiporter [Algiphilus sp. NNCM1]|uniref:potassium/proton antiporter n=1 Tax=Algiphilus sp. TaxID=1872431 RepID=UPI001CA71420|nr:potassium/proton antiporter [Algiphilus sp.]MBY8964535.1 potassium/proton antiporter [Algiphilus acroporae]MCI5063066.1 potassium/proton antiporter [Algiphilus sp.]MCI5103935.1 potassium/proton antiporter [Algiphilus sp.]
MADPVLLTILVISTLLVLSIFSSVLSFRIGAPLLLVFLTIGLVAGSVSLGGLPFDDAGLAFWLCSLGLAVVLFDSGFATPWRAYRKAAAPALTLATVGTIITAGVFSVSAYWLLPIDWPLALLLGACLSSTDAAAVFFQLRSGGVRIQERVRSTIEIESGTNDPIAIFMVIAVLAVIDGDQSAGTLLLMTLVEQFGIGAALGLLGGATIVRAINMLDIETALYPVAVLGMTLLLFSATTWIGGSGFLAVYLAGLVAGNRPLRAKYSMRRFQAVLTWLAQILMFVTLGLLAVPENLMTVFWPALGLALVLMFVARPLAVALCLPLQGFSRNETLFVSWVGLRGAVSILLAIMPMQSGIAGGELLFNVVVLVVVFSLLLQGWTVKAAARASKVLLSEQSAMIDRVELELPGRAEHELVGYRLSENSPAITGARIPRWARPSLVIRDGHSLRPHQAGALQANDTVYLFCAEHHIRLLDRIYATSHGLDARQWLGDYSLPPDALVEPIAQRFAIALPPDLKGLTLREVFEQRLRGRIELGDRVPLGEFALIVRDLSGEGTIEEVGLLVDDPETVGR